MQLHTLLPEKFCGDNSHLLGYGLPQQEQVSLGDSLYREAGFLIDMLGPTPSEIKVHDSTRYDTTEIQRWWIWSTEQRQMDCLGFFWFWEWQHNPYQKHFNNSDSTWISIYAFEKIYPSFFFSQKDIYMEASWNLVRRMIMINLSLTCPPVAITNNNKLNYSYIMGLIKSSKSPIIISTDGGHTENNENHNQARTSAAITLCLSDIRSGESISSREWEQRSVIPLLVRCMIHPHKIGDGCVLHARGMPASSWTATA